MHRDLTDLATWLAPVAVAIGGLAAGLAFRRLVLPRIARLASRTTWHLDDVLVDAVRSPSVLWFTLLGVHIGVRILPLSRGADAWLGRAVAAVAIFSVTWALARFGAGAVRASTAGALQGVSLIANVVRVVVYVLGLLIILRGLGVEITPMLTALGVGGLAVGLALQPTLANFFAGVRILAGGKLRPGDFVRLEDGTEGIIQDITWGQTTIRQPRNNLVLVPNARLAEATTINFSLPEPEFSVVVPVGVAYGSDLERVERVTLEVARQVQRDAPGAKRDFEPLLRFTAFADSAVTFNVVLRAADWEQQTVVPHEFIKRLHARYAQEGIEIPFPVRTVLMKREGGE
jgi:small-conductance mechanosensitive channel